ncbi:MAG: hypothetical protein ABIY47_10110 [Opitutaceae bacterium]
MRKQHRATAVAAADAARAALDETNPGTFNEWDDSDQKFGLKPLRASLKTEFERMPPAD